MIMLKLTLKKVIKLEQLVMIQKKDLNIYIINHLLNLKKIKNLTICLRLEKSYKINQKINEDLYTPKDSKRKTNRYYIKINHGMSF